MGYIKQIQVHGQDILTLRSPFVRQPRGSSLRLMHVSMMACKHHNLLIQDDTHSDNGLVLGSEDALPGSSRHGIHSNAGQILI